jgi:hypothetical protein
MIVLTKFFVRQPMSTEVKVIAFFTLWSQKYFSVTFLSLHNLT